MNGHGTLQTSHCCKVKYHHTITFGSVGPIPQHTPNTCCYGNIKNAQCHTASGLYWVSGTKTCTKTQQEMNAHCGKEALGKGGGQESVSRTKIYITYVKTYTHKHNIHKDTQGKKLFKELCPTARQQSEEREVKNRDSTWLHCAIFL